MFVFSLIFFGVRIYTVNNLNYESDVNLTEYTKIKNNCSSLLNVFNMDDEDDFYSLRDVLYEDEIVSADFINKKMGNTRVIPFNKYKDCSIQLDKFLVDSQNNISKVRVYFTILSSNIAMEKRVIDIDIVNGKIDDFVLVRSKTW